jgi:hypothetical protein
MFCLLYRRGKPGRLSVAFEEEEREDRDAEQGEQYEAASCSGWGHDGNKKVTVEAEAQEAVIRTFWLVV